MKKRILISVLLVILFLLSGIIFFYFSRPKVNKEVVIYPTVFVTGSGGSITDMQPIMNAFTNSKQPNLKENLDFTLKEDGTLAVKGSFKPTNRHPVVGFAMTKGTENSQTYQKGLVQVMAYLKHHYHVGSVNFVGFSSGGTGVLRYLVTDSKNHNYPPVNKFVSLDGQYNKGTAQINQDYLAVLNNGPQLKTAEYQYWQNNYQKIDSGVKVAFLTSNYDAKKETDGAVPWTDTFSPYNLLKKNGNSVDYYIFKGANLSHGNVPKNTAAIKYIKDFIYEK